LELLAAERSSRPKFVLAHLMSPHPPYVFASDGQPREAMPCFQEECSLFDGGQRYGTDEQLAAAQEQVAYLDGQVANTVANVLADSARPPVVIVMSDHGHRHDIDDHAEGLRNLFMAYTPGHENLFPDDVTPVNVLNRILGSYVGAAAALVDEPSYWVDMHDLPTNGLMRYRLTDP
jgi:hypothetical protein